MNLKNEINNFNVKMIDIAQLAQTKEWVKIGEAICSQYHLNRMRGIEFEWQFVFS
jgi:hypothetical protein